MMDITYAIIEKVAEVVFIAFMVVTLPLWFPFIALYVIIDPVYRVNLWLNTQASRNELRAEKSYLARMKKPAEASMMVLSPESS